MVTKERRIAFEEFARTLDAVFDAVTERQESVLVERDGRVYRLDSVPAEEVPDPWAQYDPATVREAWEAAREAKVLAGVDVRQLKADIKAQRVQGSAGRSGE